MIENEQLEPDASPVEAPQGGVDRTADLSSLLAEFESGTAKPDAGAPSEDSSQPAAARQAPADATLDDFLFYNDQYLRDRQQAAFANRATEEARAELAKLAQARDEADTAALLKEIRGDLDPALHDDKAIRGYVIGEFLESPAIKAIYDNRANDPHTFQALQKQLAREYHRRASARPDPDLTADRDAVVAAVRGASVNRQPENPPPSFGRMSNNDFANEVQQRYGFNPLR